MRAVDRLSFSLEPGQIYGFIGPNGAGKTTTMRILATLDLPDKGTAFVDGFDILVDPRKSTFRMGFMADRFLAYSNLDVMEFLHFFARAYGLKGRRRTERVDSVAEFCGLEPFKERPANKLSKGMGQRLHLAKTLLHDPPLLILDEPAAGLDPRARIELRELIKELAKAGKGVLISSHILSELGEICDGILIIEKGAIVTEGNLASILKKIENLSPVRVRIEGDVKEAEKFFILQPKVEDISTTDNTVHFQFTGDDREISLLIKRAFEAGLLVSAFQRTEKNLEHIFMNITKGELQ